MYIYMCGELFVVGDSGILITRAHTCAHVCIRTHARISLLHDIITFVYNWITALISYCIMI